MKDLIIDGKIAFIKNTGIEKFIDSGNKNAVLELAINVSGQAKENVYNTKTGRMRNSIMWKVKEKSGGLNDSGGMPNDKEIEVNPGEFDAYVGCNLDYSIYQEFGTRKMKPAPFLRPAIDAVVNGSGREIIKQKVNADIQGWHDSKMKRETTFF